jgi:hypothetical protein
MGFFGLMLVTFWYGLFKQKGKSTIMNILMGIFIFLWIFNPIRMTHETETRQLHTNTVNHLLELSVPEVIDHNSKKKELDRIMNGTTKEMIDLTK